MAFKQRLKHRVEYDVGVAINKYRCFDGTRIHLILVFAYDKMFIKGMAFAKFAGIVKDKGLEKELDKEIGLA